MSHSHGNTPSSTVSPDSVSHGHETTDASPSSILVFLISLVITLVLVTIVSIGLFYIFTNTQDSSVNTESAPSPLTEDRPPSPAPPLQPSTGHETLPYQDTNSLRAMYDRLAGTYGDDVMADSLKHDRMPVQAAMKILEEQGLPHDTATDIPTPQGPASSVPTPYSEGGRRSSTGTAAAPGIPQKSSGGAQP